MDITVRLSPQDDKILREIAEAEGVSPEDALLKAIHEAALHRGIVGNVAGTTASAPARPADLLELM